jgi:rhodanese-related sulfurtransferase
VANPLEITVQEATRLLDTTDSKTQPKLVDVREPDEFEVCKIDGAELLPLSAFVQDFAAKLPDKSQVILLYCHHGMRSLRAAEYLANLGYSGAKSIIGGIDKWSLEIDPEVPRY